MIYMERSEQLRKVFENVDENARILIDPMIDEVLFLEEKLDGLKKHPFISVNPRNPSQQKYTHAGKQYKELLQQYSNCIKILSSVVQKNGQEEESPLREYLKRFGK